MELRSTTPAPGGALPIYRIDLALPPRQRYQRLSLDFAPQMRQITPLFDQVIASLIQSVFLQRVVKFLARIFLRRVYSSEETEELRGIAKTSGVEFYILVAFNVLLDSLLGCTSGGVMTRPGRKDAVGERMMHFRTLDWGMDELRDVLVVLEFVNTKSDEPDKVLGRSITYAGFVGVLTGVKQDLSLSLNFRPNHSCSAVRLRIHQLLVVLAFRPSISSLLRKHIFNPATTMHSLTETLTRTTHTAPAYIILCSGQETTVIQTDLSGGVSKSAIDYISHTNHDLTPSTSSQREGNVILGMDGLLEESEDRKACIDGKWEKLRKRQEAQMYREGRRGLIAVSERGLKQWMIEYPVMNECSHFACILDPATGGIRWLERGIYDDDDDDDEEE